MSAARPREHDVVIVGAGPVGALCAVAHARAGARVALLEANPRSSRRMAGEWLHPPAVRILRELGIELKAQPCSTRGRGFVVVPEDGSEPIVLPYPEGQGLSCGHEAIVSTLREAVEDESDAVFIRRARVRSVEDGRVTFVRNGVTESLTAGRIVGADGRASTVRRSLGVSAGRITCSRMLGVTATGVSLPLEGYGYVVLGGPGPILMYQLGEHGVRIIVDVPLDQWIPRDRIGFLSDAYAGLIPETLRPAFVEAVRAGRFDTAANELRPRVTYGTPHRVLIGDAAGHYHPMTASGMALGFGDAVALAEAGDFRDFARKRFRAIHTPELLALELYEVFADHRPECAAVRRAVYRRWRASSSFRDRTIRLLACEETSPSRLNLTGGAMLAGTITREIPRSWDRAAWRRTRETARALSVRVRWLLRGVRLVRRARRKGTEDERILDSLARALPASMPQGNALPVRSRGMDSPDAGPALSRATARLLSLQGEEGAWEGEMVWCPMLTAQYVLLHHLLGRRLEPGRRRRVLRSFERTRLEGGAWGLHQHSAPHLFVSTLVYVAARLLGVERDDPLVAPARRFLRKEGVAGIPSWGKFWLALLNLYDWRGVNPVLPELWSLPRRIPLHPANWYCHTRLIYMAMAAVYARRFQAPVTPVIAALREELFPRPFADIDFSEFRNRLRDEDLYARPSRWVRAAYGFATVFERFHGKRLRARCVETILRRIRWELRTTDHASISPVSGLINILALWLNDPDDTDCRRALERLDGWIWEDEDYGARVTGARSASWDTAFSLQALATVPDAGGVRDALRRGASYLRRQQIGVGFEGFREAYRADPRGGWCFPGAWHGWPVTDCTAEAVLGVVEAHPDAGGRDDAPRWGPVHAARPEPRRGVRQLRGAALADRTRVAESRRDVRRLDDRTLLCRVHRIVPRGARGLPAALRSVCPRGDRDGHLKGRRVASGEPGKRWIVARCLGHPVHLRDDVRRPRSRRRRCASRGSGTASRVPVVAGPSTSGRGVGRAPWRMPHRPVRPARAKPGHPDGVGADRAPHRRRFQLERDLRGRPVPHRHPGGGRGVAQATGVGGLLPHGAAGVCPVSGLLSRAGARSLRGAAPDPAGHGGTRTARRGCHG